MPASHPSRLAKLRPVCEGGVQTGGNSSALVDAAAAAVVSCGSFARQWSQEQGRQPLARLLAASVVGVPPATMGIGPAPPSGSCCNAPGCGLIRSTVLKSTKRKAHKRCRSPAKWA